MPDADVEFNVISPQEWNGFIQRFDCPACKQPMYIAVVTLTVGNVMMYSPGPISGVQEGPTLMHQGFEFTLKVLDRCPACMGEYMRTYHLEEGERKALLNMIATAVTRNG